MTGLQSLLQHADSAGSKLVLSAEGDADTISEHRHKRPRTLYQERCQPPARSLQPIYRQTPQELLASLGKTGASTACQPNTRKGLELDVLLDVTKHADANFFYHCLPLLQKPEALRRRTIIEDWCCRWAPQRCE